MRKFTAKQEDTDLLLPEEPTPQDFGFPDNPTVQQMAAWQHQEAFLEQFRQHGRVCDAAAEIGLTVWAAERWDTADLYGFKKRKAVAARVHLERIEREIDRRAIEGIDHPVIHQGVITDTYKQYSDNLLMFRAKRLDPEYRDNPRVQQGNSGPSQTVINIIVPPGAELPEPTIIEGEVRLVPEEEE